MEECVLPEGGLVIPPLNRIAEEPFSAFADEGEAPALRIHLPEHPSEIVEQVHEAAMGSGSHIWKLRSWRRCRRVLDFSGLHGDSQVQ